MVEQLQLPHSVVVGKEPAPNELVVGGLAINLKDRALYTKGYDGVVFRLNAIDFHQVVEALGYTPVEPIAASLPPTANDLASAITLVNAVRWVLIECRLGS